MNPATATARDAGLTEAMRAVWERHRDEVLSRIDVVDAALVAFGTGTLADGLRSDAHRAAHKLAGSAGTFGFARGSALARVLERALDPSARISPADAPRLARAAADLRAQLEGEPTADNAPATGGAGRSEGATVVIVSGDEPLAQRLVVEAARRELVAVVAEEPAQARELALAARACTVVLDLDLEPEPEAALALLEQLAHGSPAVAVTCLSSSEEFLDRIEVARRGGRGFLARSLPAGEVLDFVGHLCGCDSVAGKRVLVVDDDVAILAAVRSLLEAREAMVTTLSDPLEFWDAVEATNPDLVLLDVDMAPVDGIELCRALRGDPRWSRLSVLFLTARTDPDTLQKLFAAGADDHVPKPIVAPELVNRVWNRLERSTLHHRLADVDALTGVSTRRASAEQMERLMRLAGRRAEPLSFAMVDIDHFKAVNDRHGHGTGDAVLQRLGALLRAAFREEDIVGRWGGEEFAVAMYGLAGPAAVARFETLLMGFRGELFQPPDGRSFAMSFSAGVTEFPAGGADLETLYRSADAALYRAKAQGRDRVIRASTLDADGR